MSDMTIAQFARAGAVGVETIRYYQRIGLVATPHRAAHGAAIRRYGEADLRRLKFIRHAQAAGFTLQEIAELLSLDATEDRARVLTIARERIAALDAKIAEMNQARDALAGLADECAAMAGPCPILAAFDGCTG
jgi:MerR family mercuric resistance operon transcriptional regulator